MDLQTHSPTNEEYQRLNWSAKRVTFLVKIFVDFHFFGFAEYESDKNFSLHLPVFRRRV